MVLIFKWETVGYGDKLETREWRAEVEVTGERSDNRKGQVTKVPKAEYQFLILCNNRDED